MSARLAAFRAPLSEGPRVPFSGPVTLGMFTRWDVRDYSKVDGQAPSPILVPSPEWEGAQANADVTDKLRKQDVFIARCTDSVVRVARHVKAVKLERCERCIVHVEAGCVATIDLNRCKRVHLHVGRPVAGIRVDDSDDVTVHASWAARVGYPDDGADGDGGERGAAGGAAATGGASAEPSLPRRHGPAPGMGLHVISSGSHAVTLTYPQGPDDEEEVSGVEDGEEDEDSSRRRRRPWMEKLVPDTLYTVLSEEETWPRTTVVTHGSWGRGQQGGMGGGGRPRARSQ
jgi:hypothetical protein